MSLRASGGTLRRCERRQQKNKIQIRWRPKPGAGPQTYVSFDSPEEDEKSTAIEAHINNVGCNISREAVLAIKHDVGLDVILSAEAVVDSERPRQSRNMPMVGELVTPYLNSIHKISAATGTIEKYSDLIRIGWLRDESPSLKGLRVDEVTSQHIRDVMVSMTECGCHGDTWGYWCGRRQANRKLSPRRAHEAGITRRTRDRYFSAIRGLMTFAVSEKYRLDNPTKDSGYKTESLAKYNTTRREEAHFYLTEEQFELIKANMPLHVQDMIDLEAETGMRFSELTGLQVWQFVARPKPKINLSEVPKFSREHGYEERGVPKGGAARVIRVSTGMGLRLEKICSGRVPTDFIFTTPRRFRITPNNFYRDVWDPAIVRAMRCPEHPPDIQAIVCGPDDLKGPLCGDNGGLNARRRYCGFPVKPETNRCYSHQGIDRDAISTCDCTDPKFPRRLPRELTMQDLRHTYNAWMKKWGVHPHVQAERLGHSPAVNYAVYGGTLDETWDELAERSARR